MKTIILITIVFLFLCEFISAQIPTYTLKVDSMRLIDIPPYEDNAIEFGVYLTHTNAPTPYIMYGQQLYFTFNPGIVSGDPFDSANVLKYTIIGSQLPASYQPRNPSIGTALNPLAILMKLGINLFQGSGIYITGATNLLMVKMRLWSRAGPFNLTNLSMAFRNPPILTFRTRLYAVIANVATDITTPETHTIDSSGLESPLPVELSNFTSSVSRNNVTLNWTTSLEINNSGFEIERSIVNGEWSIVGFVNGNGSTNSTKDYSFTDKGLSRGKYKYRLKQIDYNGNFEYFNLSNEVDVGIPTVYNLSQNYPNPFNPSTKLEYDLPEDGKMSLIVYDISGRELIKLLDEFKTAGYYTTQFNASGLSSGVYFYKLQTDDFIQTQRMVLIK